MIECANPLSCERGEPCPNRPSVRKHTWLGRDLGWGDWQPTPPCVIASWGGVPHDDNCTMGALCSMCDPSAAVDIDGQPRNEDK
jgi:hypothetical protein